MNVLLLWTQNTIYTKNYLFFSYFCDCCCCCCFGCYFTKFRKRTTEMNSSHTRNTLKMCNFILHHIFINSSIQHTLKMKKFSRSKAKSKRNKNEKWKWKLRSANKCIHVFTLEYWLHFIKFGAIWYIFYTRKSQTQEMNELTEFFSIFLFSFTLYSIQMPECCEHSIVHIAFRRFFT